MSLPSGGVTGEFLHVVAIADYDLPVNLLGFYAGPTDNYRSYLRTEFGGDGGRHPSLGTPKG